PERAAIALVAALLLACLVAPRGRWRWLVVLVAAWCMARAPIGYSLHMAEQFSPALFYRSMLGVFSASAGALTVLGVVALCAASVLWRRGLARRWWNVVGAAGLVLAGPCWASRPWPAPPPPSSRGVPRWKVASGSPSGTFRDWAARPIPAPCRCSSGSGGTRPPRRHGLRVSCTRGGWRRRSPKTTIR